jgi:pantoate--beta-alanine ligase
MRIVRTIAELRAARRDFGDLGFVPTMGFLHAGHISLVNRAKAECGAVAVSIFVNPTQFSPAEDLDRYPRDEARDLALLTEAGADLVYLPGVEEMYPAGAETRIDVGSVSRVLEGASRPTHFAGVATVVAKLFNQVQPSRAYFGQKDAQQCVVIRALVRDLDIPVEVVIGETVREPDGLALSSRNAYLSAEQRAAAPVLNRALRQARDMVAAGERDAEVLRQAMRDLIATEPLGQIDYVSIAHPDCLAELDVIRGGALASLAVRFGSTRLIDNLILS